MKVVEKISKARRLDSGKLLSRFLLLLLFFCACRKNPPETTATEPRGNPRTSIPQDTLAVTVPHVDSIPASLTIYAGDGQTGLKGYPLPINITVMVRNKAGLVLQHIPVSFKPCSGCGITSKDSTVTDMGGQAFTIWSLGNSADSNQTLTATLLDSPFLSVTFKAIAEPSAFHNYVGTITINDTTANDSPVGGEPNFPTLSYNTPMPFELDSMAMIGSVISIAPKVARINGHAIANRDTIPVSFTISEQIDYPIDNPGPARLLQYIMVWNFTGFEQNNVINGDFVLQVFTATLGSPNPITGNPGDIYNGEKWRYGVFTVTMQ